MPRITSNDGSSVFQILTMPSGGAYSRVQYIAADDVTPEEVQKARKKLNQYLTPIVGRAKKKKNRDYRIHTVAAFTRDYDVIVTGIIVVFGDDEEDDDEI